MWVFLNNAFLSIVHKDCEPDQLMVRARRRGDIERVFPGAEVTEYTRSDYMFRAPVSREEIAKALTVQVAFLNYDNFKNSIEDPGLHSAAERVWDVMAKLQEKPPYSGYIWDYDHDAWKKGR